MRTPRRIMLLLIACSCLFGTASVNAQDFFTDQITKGIRVGIEDFATVPDSSGAPARMSMMTTDSLNRLFVNDQRGQIHLVSGNGSSVTEYLDIDDFSGVNLISGGEVGFQSFAFHPDFSNAGTGGFGKLYTIHSSNNTSPTADFAIGSGDSLHSVVMEWSTNDPNASTYSAGGNNAPREVLRFGQPFTNHNGGQVSFNTSVGEGHADRSNLYIGLGDGGSGGDPLNAGQTTSNPFGALLRIDPLGNDSGNGEYGIVSANVLASDGDADTLGEIYAFGLRNPQRFGWDSQTGNLYLADIGQNAVEEIDLVVNGGNFGWNEREGSFGQGTAAMIDPVAEYDHTNVVADVPTTIGNRAVTVGDVVRGSSIAGLDGKLMLGDFPTGLIFYLDVDNDALDGGQDGLFELSFVDDTGTDVRLLDLINQARIDRGLGTSLRADLRFSHGSDGQVYVLNKHDGIIRRLVSVPEPSGVAMLLVLSNICLLRRRRSSCR